MRYLPALVLALVACGDPHAHDPDATDVATDTAAVDTAAPADTADTAQTDTLAPPVWDDALHPWPMFGQNPRRTGRSPFVGPQTHTPGASENWRYAAEGGASINIQATVTAAGVYFGTWGTLRRASEDAPPDTWVKSDGRYYGLDLATGAEQFAPVDPRPVRACYRYAGHAKGAVDRSWCGDGSDWLVTFYNGTIEGTALLDPGTGLHVIGRGDGAVYAIDPSTGQVAWTFDTFNPEDPADPDGGGEVVGGPLMDARGRIYVASWGVPWPGDAEQEARETHAVYALDRAGGMLWRYPSAAASLDNPILAPLALSPDGDTLYAASWISDTSVPGRLYAFDLTAADDASDDARLRWSLAMTNPDRPLQPSLYARHVSVGAGGTVFIGAAEARLLGSAAAVVAVADRGDRGEILWLTEPDGYPDADGHLTQGLALWEEAGETVRIYASTAHTRVSNGRRGSLVALDPDDGAVLGRFEPHALAPPAVGGLTGPTLGADEAVYVGVRGRHDLLQSPDSGAGQWRPGHVFALRWSAATGTFEALWRLELDGQIDWATPAIGADGALYFGTTAPFRPTEQAAWSAPGEVPPHASPWFYRVAR